MQLDAPDPNSSISFYNKGLTLESSYKYVEAIECYEKAIHIDANYAEAFNRKGFALEKINRYSEAIECYNKAIFIQPNFKLAIDNKKKLTNLLKN